MFACFSLYIDKTCVHDVISESLLQYNTDTLACLAGVRIIPLYSWITCRYINLDQWGTNDMNNQLFLFVQDLVAVEFSSSCGLAYNQKQ